MIEFNLATNYQPIFILFVLASVVAIVLLVLSYLLVNQTHDSEKLSTYECGFEPYENTRHIFNIRFCLIAIFFIIFDIEMLFLIPWCVSAANINMLGFWSMIDFLFELLVGFIYIWYTNSIDW